MIQLLSLTFFAAVLLASILAIISTVKAESAHMTRAFGGDPFQMPPQDMMRSARPRIIRRPIRSGRPPLRAAA